MIAAEPGRVLRSRTASCLFAAFAAAVMASGCVPIQAARNVQIETYEQQYKFCDAKQAGRAISAIIGDRALVDLRYFEQYKDDALCCPFHGAGQVVFEFSSHPANRDLFFIEGRGRYVVYNHKSTELIATADIRIVDTGPYRIAELDRGFLIVRFEQMVVREFEQHARRFANKADVFVKVRVKKLDSGLFAIDYGKEHESAVPDLTRKAVLGQGLPVMPIGTLTFDAPDDDRKLVDLRSRSLVKTYQDLDLHAGRGSEGADWPAASVCDEASRRATEQYCKKVTCGQR